jgi:bacterioferritin-associated ferredoxin
MYVCLCAGVTDREIHETLAEGASSVEEVAHCTGAGMRCGSCVPALAAMVEDAVGVASGRRERGDGAHRPCLRVLTRVA